MWWSIIGMGGTAWVTSVDKKTALKGYEVWEDGELRASRQIACEDVLAREAAIYKHMGEHPQILCCYGLEEVHSNVRSLRLEYAPFGDLRKFIRERKNAPLPEDIRLRMALDVALGVAHVHSRGVQHCDISCRNLLLFEDFRVKICDFGGSLVEGYGYEDITSEESAYELPLRGREFEALPARKRELFALGSAIYEIMAWTKPYEELSGNVGVYSYKVEQKYAAGEFPSLEGISAGNVIRRCWDEKCESTEEVVEALQALLAVS